MNYNDNKRDFQMEQRFYVRPMGREPTWWQCVECVRSVMTERAGFEDEALFANSHFDSTLKDQYEIVGRLAL